MKAYLAQVTNSVSTSQVFPLQADSLLSKPPGNPSES